jgi:flagellar protein FlaI
MSAQLPQQRLSVPADVDEDQFYTLNDGTETLVTHADLEEAVDNREKPHLREKNRYWVNKPYAFVVIYENIRDSELRYMVVEPRLSPIERDIVNFFRDKLRTSLNYDRVNINAPPADRARIIRNETLGLMKRYNLLGADSSVEATTITGRLKEYAVAYLEQQAENSDFEESVRNEAPTPVDSQTGEIQTLNRTQVRRILYYLVRDFIRFNRIDAIKRDVNVEDISCDGYNTPVFVYHSDFGEQIVTNVDFGETDLDNFVKNLAQRAGKGISKRQPNVDATLADGSRGQLTLGREISSRGTNFTIRQFNDIPFTPVDLINWRTFNIDQIVYLWLAIENGKSIVYAGGTASGKTTTLNAVSLFMPGTSKIVSIEDTRELEIPQSNWVPNMTRESFQEDGAGSVDEFDLLEDALRKRPDYVIMGEVRGEEGQTLFQLMNTGHTTYTTFHANKPREVVRRFTTDPITVAPSMFEALDIITLQETVDMGGRRVRRGREIVEINEYNATTNQFSMNDAFRWDRETDTFNQKGKSSILREIQNENAMSDQELREEWNRRRLVLAYLVDKNINTYAGVAATLQGYMSAKDTMLALISDDKLRERIAALHQMKTIDIDADPEKEALIPRPLTPGEVKKNAENILDETQSLLSGYDSENVDFARTVEDMLTDDELTGEQRALLNELTESDPTGELPGGFDPEMTSSEAFRGQSENAMELDDELAELFGDEEDGESSDQMILTSDTLNKLREVPGAPAPEPDSGDDQRIGDIDSLFDDDEESEGDESTSMAGGGDGEPTNESDEGHDGEAGSEEDPLDGEEDAERVIELPDDVGENEDEGEDGDGNGSDVVGDEGDSTADEHGNADTDDESGDENENEGDR